MTRFQIVSRIVFLASVVFIFSCIVLQIILEYSNLEFVHVVNWFEKCVVFGIPIALLLTMFRMAYTKQAPPVIAAITISTVALALFAFIFLGMSVFLNLCGSITSEIYFQSKENPAKKIVKRHFGCGVFDSSPPNIHICEIHEYPFGLIYVTHVDTAKINLNLWNRVD